MPAPRFRGRSGYLKVGSRSSKLEKARNTYNFTPNPIKPSEFLLSNRQLEAMCALIEHCSYMQV